MVNFSIIEGVANGHTFMNLEAGKYTFTEADMADWTLGDITCSGESDYTANEAAGSVSIDLEAGDEVVCTFLNVAEAGEAGGSLTIVATWVGGAAGSATFNASAKLGATGNVQCEREPLARGNVFVLDGTTGNSVTEGLTAEQRVTAPSTLESLGSSIDAIGMSPAPAADIESVSQPPSAVLGERLERNVQGQQGVTAGQGSPLAPSTGDSDGTMTNGNRTALLFAGLAMAAAGAMGATVYTIRRR